MRRFLLVLLRLVLLLALAGGLVAAYEWWQYGNQPVVTAGNTASFEVRRGEGGRPLAATLQRAGIVVQGWELALAWRLRGDSARIKAGRYELEGPVTLRGLLDQLVEGQPPKEHMIALIEGWNFRQVREALAKAPELVQVTADLTDAQVMQRLDPQETHPEGRFAPDTYAYPPGGTDLEVLARAYTLQQQRLAAAWADRAEGLPLKNERELLILASIVEKESARDEERPLVASVFDNRLRRGMPLQSDPTTIYGIGERFDGNLKRGHLREDTPYNTYVRGGLTPTPISMPGKGALQATAHPAETNALYFVSRGDGTSEFSETLDRHNNAVNRYQRKVR
jgi:UPF0755 protein